MTAYVKQRNQIALMLSVDEAKALLKVAEIGFKHAQETHFTASGKKPFIEAKPLIDALSMAVSGGEYTGGYGFYD